jgi:hypothetical protein
VQNRIIFQVWAKLDSHIFCIIFSNLTPHKHSSIPPISSNKSPTKTNPNYHKKNSRDSNLHKEWKLHILIYQASIIVHSIFNIYSIHHIAFSPTYQPYRIHLISRQNWHNFSNATPLFCSKNNKEGSIFF